MAGQIDAGGIPKNEGVMMVFAASFLQLAKMGNRGAAS